MGRVRPYVSTAVMGATVGMGEHPLIVFDRAIALVRVAIVILIWRAILAIDAQDQPASVLTYVVLAQVLAGQLHARSDVLFSIWDGRVATRLLRPVSIFGDYIAEMVGGWGLQWLTFSMPAIAVALLLRVDLMPASAAHAAAFVGSLALSIGVGTALDFLYALIVIRWSETTWAFYVARESLVPVLSGAVIPLALLPWALGEALAWLPFASMVSAPLLIFSGAGDVGRLLALQAAWATTLWMTTRYAWKRAAPRMVSFGG